MERLLVTGRHPARMEDHIRGISGYLFNKIVDLARQEYRCAALAIQECYL